MTSQLKNASRRRRRLPATVAAVALLVMVASGRPAPAAEASSRAATTVRSGAWSGPALRAPTYVAAPVEKLATARFEVTFDETRYPYPPAARAAFMRAVDIWATQITSSVPIIIKASFDLSEAPLGGSLATVVRDIPELPRPGVWYGQPLEHHFLHRTFSSDFDMWIYTSPLIDNWHYGAGPAPVGDYDFTTVVLQLMATGLGISSLGFVGSGPHHRGHVVLDGDPGVYELATETAAGRKLTSFPQFTTALGQVMQSGALYYDNARVRAVNGGAPARLWAPDVSSSPSVTNAYRYLDEATYPPGDPNSLMTPFLSPGETIRNPGPIARAILVEEGWKPLP